MPLLDHFGPAGLVLLFKGEVCRGCGKQPSHFVVRKVKPDAWVEAKAMQLLAVAWCHACSPARMKEPGRPPLLTLREPKPFWRRWLRTA